MLARYTWDERSGTAKLTYLANGSESEIVRQEPTSPRHAGWNGAAVLKTRPRSEMIYDALFGYVAGAFDGNSRIEN